MVVVVADLPLFPASAHHLGDDRHLLGSDAHQVQKQCGFPYLSFAKDDHILRRFVFKASFS